MNKEILSRKQKHCLSLLKANKLRRINILEGSVRSGKTYVSLVMWGFWVAGKGEGKTFLMAGKTLETLKRNVLAPLSEIFGEDNFTYSVSKKEASLFGRRIFLEGAGDSVSETKIRGITLDGAYLDELTIIDEGFFSMLLSRLSTEGAMLIATTNPDHPRHWLKRKYIDNPALDLLDIRFSIDDNIFLPPKYVENLKREYTGMLYKRFILGEWVMAEGRVYPDFDRSKAVVSPEELDEILEEAPPVLTVAGVDFGGNRSASVFILVGFSRGFRKVFVLDEHYDPENRSAEALIDAFRKRVARWRSRFANLFCAYCDSAEQLLIKSFRSAVSLEVRNALKSPVNGRITMLNRLIASDRLIISGNCPEFISAVENAVWDNRLGEKDSRLDDGTTNIDSLDAFEYAIERYQRELFRL